MKNLYRFIDQYKRYAVIGFICKLLEAMLEVYLPILMARLIDFGIKKNDLNYVYQMGIWLFVFIVLGYLFALVCQYFASVASVGTGTNLRNAMIEKISTFSYVEIDKLGTSTLINRITTDVNYIQQAVVMTIRLVSRAPFLCIGAIIMSFSIDVPLTLMFIVIVILLFIIQYYFMVKNAPLYKKAQQKLDDFALVIRENLSGVRVIRAFDQGINEEDKINRKARKLSNQYNKVANLAGAVNPITSSIVNIGIILVLYLGASRVYRGELSSGNIFALATYATKILYAINIISNITVLFTKASASLTRVNEILDTEPKIKYNAEPGVKNQISESEDYVIFDNVSFSYNKTEKAISNISFGIKKHETVGLVGVTGSGKTTIVNLLQRFYETGQGNIFIARKNIRDYDKKSLRKIFGISPQKSVLFKGSVRDNISFGTELSDEEIVNALKISQGYEFVNQLENGIDTMIHESGKNLSGGQRQRLTIARAIAKKPEILIFDDSLSALDYKTDLNLRRAITDNLADSIKIIISQRISSIMNADKIIVLNEGNIEGIGKHEDLLDNSEIYRELYHSQIELK